MMNYDTPMDWGKDIPVLKSRFLQAIYNFEHPVVFPKRVRLMKDDLLTKEMHLIDVNFDDDFTYIILKL